MLKLYYAPGACSLAPHIALEEAGGAFETERVDLRSGQQKTPEYLAINPKGAVPALQTDGGVLTENPAVLRYIGETHPDAGLVPTGDAFRLAQFQSVTTFLAASVHPAMSRLLFSRPPLEEPAKSAAREMALAKLRIVEESLLKGPWVDGERFTVADGYLYVFERWAQQAGLFADGGFPKLSEHLQRVQARPAVQRALEREGLQPL